MYYVYILTNWSNKVLYTGITNNLERRLYEPKNKIIKGFTEKYNVNKSRICCISNLFKTFASCNLAKLNVTALGGYLFSVEL